MNYKVCERCKILILNGLYNDKRSFNPFVVGSIPAHLYIRQSLKWLCLIRTYKKGFD